MLNIRNQIEGSLKIERRDRSNASNQSSSCKFLKRKPDHKRIMEIIETKRKYSVHKNYCLPQSTRSQRQIPIQNISIFKSESSRYISSKGQQNYPTRYQENNKKLLTVKSDKNFKITTTQNEKKNNLLPEDSKLQYYQENKSKNQSLIFNQEDIQASQSVIDYSNRYKQINKKSRTQYFIQDQFKGSQFCQFFQMEDNYELSQSKQSKQFKRKNKQHQVQLIKKKKKTLQDHLEILKEKEHLLETENKHLNQILKQKDRIIDRLTRQKVLLSTKNKYKSQHDIITILQKTQAQLRAEQQRIIYLKQENSFLSTQILQRSQQLIRVQQIYRQLEDKFKDYKLKMIEKIQQMKIEVEQQKIKAKDQLVDFDSYGQLEKWKERVLTLQEQVKYLRIQNQCLMVSKKELQKSEQQNRKLKQQRDYFKKKVLQNVKRIKQIKNQTSFSNSSLLFQLSQRSIEM